MSDMPSMDDVYGKPKVPPRRDQDTQGRHVVPLELISPDLTQPRRTIPSQYRNGVSQLALQHWVNGVWAEVGDIVEGILGAPPKERPDNLELSPAAAALLDLVELAASIRRDGLTNAITVVKVGDVYRIETGERRWLAFNLLQWFYGDQTTQWSRIPVQVVPQSDVWRQATENTSRSNLNSIAKARQYALLMMDLYKDERVFKDIGDFDHEREFYEQGDLDMPYGKRDEVLAAMGFKSPAELTRSRKALHLSNVIWQEADDRNTPQKVLDRVFDLPIDDALKIVQSLNDSAQDMKKAGRKPNRKNRAVTDRVDTFGEQTLKQALRLSNADRRQVAARFRAWADAIESSVNNKKNMI